MKKDYYSKLMFLTSALLSMVYQMGNLILNRGFEVYDLEPVLSFEKSYWSGEISRRILDRGEEDQNVAWSNKLFHKVGNIYFIVSDPDF